MKNDLKVGSKSNRKDLLIWLLLSIPWVWPIIFQPIFWDDWHNISNKSLMEQSNHFLFGGGKSFISPLLFQLVNFTSPRIAHLICFAAMICVSRLIGELCELAPLNLCRKSTTWITYSLPIFHARFSISVIEYAICFLFLLLAWRSYIRKKRGKNQIFISVCIFVAISMPSTIILVPFILVHRVLIVENQIRIRKVVHSALTSPEIYLPVGIYSLIFKILLNSTNKYQFSIGGTFAWVRLLTASAIFLVLLMKQFKKIDLTNHLNKMLLLTHVLVLVSFLPYFAIGYNPLRSFLPNLWSSVYLRDNASRFAICFLLMLLLGSAVEKIINKRDFRIRATVAYLLIALFSSIFAIIGPLDWDSRLWILTIPGLAIGFYTLDLFGFVNRRSQFGTIAILLAANSIISAEYFFDFLKQNAFVTAVEELQKTSNGITLNNNDELMIYVDRNKFSEKFTARARIYRQYDFSGPISKATEIPYEKINIQFDESELPSSNYCLTNPMLNILIPNVSGSAINFLSFIEYPKIKLHYFYGLDPRCG